MAKKTSATKAGAGQGDGAAGHDDADRQPQREAVHLSHPQGDGRTRGRRHPQVLRRYRVVHVRSGLRLDRQLHSTITYIDGEAGVLEYRGYPIEQLAEKSHFLEVAYLVINGELPNARQQQEFEQSITHHTMLHEQMQFFFRGFRRDSHPMAVMCGVVGALSAFYHDHMDFSKPRTG